MISVTDDFKTAMRAPVKMVRASMVMDNEIVYASGDVLVKLDKTATGYYFGVVTQSMDLTLLGTEYDLIGHSFVAYLDVCTDLSNEIWASSCQGKFTICEQTVDLEKGITTAKAYDAIGMMAKTEYASGDLAFPCTVNALAVNISEFCQLNYTEQELVNGEYEIQEELYEKINQITFRDILAEIAGASATLASAHGDNSTLSFTSLPFVAIETLSYDNLKKVKLEPKYGVVNSVVLSRMPQEDNIVVKDEGSIAEHGLTEVKLANNEILDDGRELLAQPILDAVDGFYFYPFEATTEGHGWYEVGDKLGVTDGTNTWDVIVTDIKLTIDGGIKEVIKGVAPDATTTDYSLAGGIKKTIYNTEIKVDKQNQHITSIVSQQESFENETHEAFTTIRQDLSSIITTIQTTGGGNMLHNSVGYNKNTDHSLVDWDCFGTVSSMTSPESISYGALSGNQIDLSVTSSITQRVYLSSDMMYTLSCKIKKGTVGSATIHLRNEEDDFSITIPDGESKLWQNVSIVGVQPTLDYLDVVVETDAYVDLFAITDIMLSVGDSSTPWVSASDEILSKNVAIDLDGVKVSSNTTADYVKLDELGLNGYSDASGHLENVFTINRDTTELHKLNVRKEIDMRPIKIVPITSGTRKGWAFVKTES